MDISAGFGSENTPNTIVNGKAHGDYKYLATVGEHSGNPVIAWTENSDNNIFGVSPENRVEQVGSGPNAEYEYYVYATNANSLWVNVSGESICVLDGLSTVMDVEICNGNLYYILDADGDLSDSSDCSLYSIPLASIKNAEPTLVCGGTQ